VVTQVRSRLQCSGRRSILRIASAVHPMTRHRLPRNLNFIIFTTYVAPRASRIGRRRTILRRNLIEVSSVVENSLLTTNLSDDPTFHTYRTKVLHRNTKFLILATHCLAATASPCLSRGARVFGPSSSRRRFAGTSEKRLDAWTVNAHGSVSAMSWDGVVFVSYQSGSDSSQSF